jgi:hypothetical protein
MECAFGHNWNMAERGHIDVSSHGMQSMTVLAETIDQPS